MHTDDDRDELARLRITTQTDLHRMWELLMQPLGWRSTSIWVTFIGHDRRPTRLLVEIADDGTFDDEGGTGAVPSESMVDHLYAMLGQVLTDQPDAATVAFLVARPGRGPLSASDRLFGSRLLAGARRSGVPIEPVHVATDVAIWAIAPDDLAA